MKMMSKPSILTLSGYRDSGPGPGDEVFGHSVAAPSGVWSALLLSFWRLCTEEEEDRGETKREEEMWRSYVKEEGKGD